MNQTARLFATCAAFTASLAVSAERADLVVADFEGDDYGTWKVEGTAFGMRPARGTLPGQMPVGGFLGKGLVNSFNGGDDSQGKLTSPPITIERKYINFQIGGGKYPAQTCINLIVDGKVVRTATGPNDRPGGSEQLDWASWDVGEFAGKTAEIEIVDARQGGWGHISIDHILQSDRPQTFGPAKRELLIEKRYLDLPVKTGGRKLRMKFVDDGTTVREFEIELAEEKPDLWAFADVSRFHGRRLSIEVDRLPAESHALEAIRQADDPHDAGRLYSEPARPRFHFTSRCGWLNDPNGLVYSRGEWHLFYQHNPYGWSWGNMHWGHAVSEDLFHWNELPIALYPQRFGDWCFSGSAVVDAKNTSRFKTGEDDLLVAAYTSTGRGECIVYSNDSGRTWTEFEGNPVVKHAGRDPKLVWHEPSKSWVMAVYDEFEGRRMIAFYSSKNLKSWDFQSRIDGFFECPDLFELPLDGKPRERRWVLSAADGKYVLGQFDGREFHPETEKLQLWHGNFYAAQTYDNAPEGRRIQIGWGQGIEFPGMPFNQQMVIPVELSLRRTSDGPRMFAEPVRELARLHGKERSWSNVVLVPGENPLAEVRGELLRIVAELEPGQAESAGFVVRGVPVRYDAGKRQLTCKGITAPLEPIDGRVTVEIVADRGSLEIFGGNGRVALSVGGQLPAENVSVRTE
ncbi:MAG: glycoside hydrolase family 32 protein, partial [Deltaproteobacteria bacterium]